MSIEEVGLQLEHVLLMPTETLQNLILCLLSVVPLLRLTYGMLSDYSIDHRYFSLYVFPVFRDDQRRLHSSFEIRE